MSDPRWLQAAIDLASQGAADGTGGPFGAVVVLDGEIIGRGQNEVTTRLDPSAHAEVQAIRDACRNQNDFRLRGATLYSSCEPCPMCLAAIYWARVDRLVYAASRHDAAAAGFDDELLYTEIPLDPADRQLPMEQQMAEEGLAPFEIWRAKDDRVDY